ncbi:hypothetical protein HPB47_019673 [Ixodes persulcatus]|uniref:Uncharacterized protein n=1 Tax=Ixodes persulcatus TaxID=34615 RepID=A0AC60QHT5_IXOPE|nr:hypothetical protein HPB47_019673 [Ixodes persulcatus]
MPSDTKDSTDSTDFSDVTELSDIADLSNPTNIRRGQAHGAERVISNSGSRSPGRQDDAGRRPKMPPPGSSALLDASLSSAKDF